MNRIAFRFRFFINFNRLFKNEITIALAV
jgi:hypothetical protein